MPLSSREVRVGIATYLLCTFALSSVFYALIINAERLAAAGGLYALGLMWCPAAGALITCHLRGRPLASLGWSWETRYLRASYALPVLYVGVAYAVVWLTGLGGFPNPVFIDTVAADAGISELPHAVVIGIYVALVGSVGMIGAVMRALGEEIGWRGFLVPELAKVTSFTTTALLSGIVWAAWYMPLLLFSDYNNGTSVRYGATCFTLTVLGLSFLFAWIRLRSGSLWTAVVLHASQSLFIQSVFAPLTIDLGETRYVVGEFGVALTIVSLVVAVIVWTQRRVVDRRRLGAEVSSPLHELLLRSTARPVHYDREPRFTAANSRH